MDQDGDIINDELWDQLLQNMYSLHHTQLLLCCLLLATCVFASLPSSSTASPTRFLHEPARLTTSTKGLPKGVSIIYPHQKIMEVRGGSTPKENEKASLSGNLKKNLLGLWGVFQVVSILANAIKRLVPVALQPFQQNDLQPMHWVMYVAWCLVMAYSEGYRAFQLKFSPMVVSRAFDLVNNTSFFNLLLSGPYCMGMFNASRKRMIVSWCITAGVFSLVKLVKFLPYPYRSIVDAGVVVGLSYGTLSIVALTVKALFGGKVVDSDSAKSE